jgi:hypothetical protein
MKLLTLILSVIPCFIFAQTEGERSEIDTIKPSLDELYHFGTTNSGALKEGWKKFDNELIDRVYYPKDWEIFENFMGTVFMITSPLSETDAFAENISLTRQAIKTSTQTLTLESYVEIRTQENQKYLENFDIIEERDGSYLNDPAKIVVSTGKKDDVLFKIKQYFFIKGNWIYLYTYSAELDVFEEFESIDEDIYKSLRINKK